MCPPKHLHWRLHWWTLSYCPTQSVHGSQQLQRTTEQRILCFLYFSSIFNAIIYLNLWFGMSLVSYVCMLHLIYNGCATKAAPEQQLQYSVTVQTADLFVHTSVLSHSSTHNHVYMREKKHTYADCYTAGVDSWLCFCSVTLVNRTVAETCQVQAGCLEHLELDSIIPYCDQTWTR